MNYIAAAIAVLGGMACTENRKSFLMLWMVWQEIRKCIPNCVHP